METTPCGLLKFSEVDSYNYSDAKTNFDRPDELLARLGAHESRFFSILGLTAMEAAGVQVNTNWNVTGFTFRAVGEWYYISIIANPKTARNRSASHNILNLPARLSAIHTQKLGGTASGRGARGWVSSSGAVWLGSFSGTETQLAAGNMIQLAGWYLPQSSMTTVGVPSIGEKSPFFSNYISALNVIDGACKKVNTNLVMDSKDTNLTPANTNPNYLMLDGKNFFFRDTGFEITSGRFRRVNDFAFVAINMKVVGNKTIDTDGTVNVRMGTIVSSEFSVGVTQPMENDNAGRTSYSYLGDNGELILKAVGKGGSNSTLLTGEEISVAGYYRIGGTM